MPTSAFDLTAAPAGPLGIAPTANLDPERRLPSMFEPIHGPAFDIADRALFLLSSKRCDYVAFRAAMTNHRSLLTDSLL